MWCAGWRLGRADAPQLWALSISSTVASTDSGDATQRNVANAAAILQGGEWKATYRKILLPNYGVFDEERYFIPGEKPDFLWEIGGIATGRLDLRRHLASRTARPRSRRRPGPKSCLNINGSPYHHGKAIEREQMLGERARAAGVPVVYLNMVGGQDELVFDGHSMVLAPTGEVIHRSPQFDEDRFLVDLDLDDSAARDESARSWDPRRRSTGRSNWVSATTCERTGFTRW